MDTNKYIASGILENYALGLVSESEAREVEQNVQRHPELKAELDKIEAALLTYAQSKAMPMPEGLRDQILQSINSLENQPNAHSDNKITNPAPTPSKGTNWAAILLGTLLLATLGSLFWQYTQHEATQDDLALANLQNETLNNQMVNLQLECDQKDERINRLQEQIAILKNPAYRPISLQGTDKAPDAEAIVYYNVAENRTYFDIGNLPAPPSDRDYQLWAIVDGQPTDMGPIDLSTATGRLIEVPHIRNPQAFAMTLETKGGNPTPNLNELYVIGNV